jgi:hypothetical protein
VRKQKKLKLMRISSWIEKKSIRTPPAVKNRLCRAENWADVMRSSPVALSTTAPVADLYLVSPFVARSTRVVPGMIGVIYQDILGKFPLTGVNNTGSGGEDARRGSVADRLVDSPEFAGWEGSGNWAICVNQYRRFH